MIYDDNKIDVPLFFQNFFKAVMISSTALKSSNGGLTMAFVVKN